MDTLPDEHDTQPVTTRVVYVVIGVPQFGNGDYGDKLSGVFTSIEKLAEAVNALGLPWLTVEMIDGKPYINNHNKSDVYYSVEAIVLDTMRLYE